RPHGELSQPHRICRNVVGVLIIDLPIRGIAEARSCEGIALRRAELLPRAANGAFELRLADLVALAFGLADDESAAALILGFIEFVVCHGNPHCNAATSAEGTQTNPSDIMTYTIRPSPAVAA